jgi:hypothetical protein
MATEKKLYTLADVAVHNNANDCWLVIDGQVSEHPLSFGALSAPVFLRRSCLLSPSSAWLRSRCSLLSLEHIFFLLLLSCCFCCYLLVPYLPSVGRNVSVKWAFPCQASRILHNPLAQVASSGYSCSFCFLCVFTAYSSGWFIGGALLMIRGKRVIVPLAFVADL